MGTPTTTTFGYSADELTSFGGATIGYNAMGCPTSYEGKTATWSKGRLSRLSSGTLSSGTTNFSYNYNALGQRISKTYSYLEGTSGSNPIYTGQITSYFKKYFYDHSGRLIAETTTKSLYGQGAANESIVFLYDESGMIGMEYTSGGTTNLYYFQRNLQGDVVAIYDVNGTLKAKYLYDAWGNCTISSETTSYDVANANPIRYRGYYYDDDTGLYFCNARYYSPKWRRFISPDDTAYLSPESVNGLNLYCYCNNDPVNVGSTAPKEVNKTNTSAANLEFHKPTRGKQHKSISSFRLPKSNHVMMTYHTTSLQKNAFGGGFLGNISYTVTTQWNESEPFYSYTSTSDEISDIGMSFGVGINIGNWYGRSVYISSSIGIGSSTQLTPWFTYGSELSVLEGITLSAGIISGNTTHEISVNIGWGTIAFAYVLACVPLPGIKIAASVILLCDLLI